MVGRSGSAGERFAVVTAMARRRLARTSGIVDGALLLESLAGIKMTSVHYRGAAPALNDLIAGHINIITMGPSVALPAVAAGKIHMLGFGSQKRVAQMPDMPTIAETVPGYEVELWYGVLGPKGLPKNIVERWNAEIRKATKLPDLKERLIAEGFDIDDSPPSVFQAKLKSDVEKWQRVVKEAKVKPQ